MIYKNKLIGIIIIVLIMFSCKNDPEECSHNGIWKITTFPTKDEPFSGIEKMSCTKCNQIIETRSLSLSTFKSYFYGEWAIDEDPFYIVIIDTNKIQLKDPDDSTHIEICQDLIWNVLSVNEYNDTKLKFVSGFSIDGVMAPESVCAGKDSTYTFYINNLKDEIFFLAEEYQDSLIFKKIL